MSLIFIFLKVAFIGLAHDFYMSVSTISIYGDKAVLEIKVFKDDLEKVLDVSLDDLSVNTKDMVFEYFRKNFKISSNDNDVKIHFKNVTDQGESVVVTSEFHFEENQKLTVTNTIFLSEFANQINMVHLKRQAKTNTVIFYRNRKTHTF